MSFGPGMGVPGGGAASTVPDIVKEAVTSTLNDVKRVGAEVAGDIGNQLFRGISAEVDEAITSVGLDVMLSNGWTASGLRALGEAGMADAEVASLIVGGVDMAGAWSIAAARGLVRAGARFGAGGARMALDVLENPEVQEFAWSKLADAFERRATAELEALYGEAGRVLEVPVAEVRDYVESGELLFDMPLAGAQATSVVGLAAAFGANWDRMMGREPASDDPFVDPMTSTTSGTSGSGGSDYDNELARMFGDTPKASGSGGRPEQGPAKRQDTREFPSDYMEDTPGTFVFGASGGFGGNHRPRRGAPKQHVGKRRRHAVEQVTSPPARRRRLEYGASFAYASAYR
jgi:hypothetical protein